MNETRRIRLLTIAFILLVALNIATLTAFFVFKKHGPPAAPKGGTADFLVKELALDSAQQEQLKTLIREHRQQVRDLREQNRAAKDAFFDLLKDSVISDSALAEAAAGAAAAGQQMDIFTFRHFQKVRALCNEEQKRRFDAIIHEVLHMNAGPAGAAPGGPPPGDRGMMPPPQ
ncbi:Spy/CpxP family protein refolding chaperone [Sediminibacterium soli]|uniref:Spy/CpxP family protein refolding chaperone n=1 Tax=Sediminibacterium soli TaxID=2698829 RepID=UPI00137B8BA7|nr:periplasmic heavy metal sensor [Sediminibacterium soli]NCI47242.1 periplasmic heavy metal sensor [Sediminibacterium soli]